ncbi:unnamed protein product [Aphanomyces euteiches]|uniref:cGMP-dependent protein kinase n=1 Tax=Aphanomyces euteiches TaxID=100861 RepID=A0A6G0X1G2_9STRA|nr:hypothetical protein Ae201684_009549 [Aphanomyces euteiches]KAH9085709.1 hypothetical protein Ae201684P_005412 [Aphanomyces euteiches]
MGNCCSSTAAVTRHSELLPLPPPPPPPPQVTVGPFPTALSSSHAPEETYSPESHDMYTPPLPTPPPPPETTQSLSVSPPMETFQRSVTGPLTAQDLDQRTTAPEKTSTFQSGDYKISYAYVSQRGYYPDSLYKPNQDSFACKPMFYGKNSFFGVFDGHGTTGDLCAQYARDVVPMLLQQNLTKNLNTQEALIRAHTDANTMMHAAQFDDSMSGTTAISVLFQGNEIHVSNVGDSRAIIAQEISQDGKAPQLIAKALSIDQTPFRKDERERVKKTGARIMTVDQLEGYEPIHENWGLTLGDEIDESGDPPRIWHSHGDYPGTAFTRSIGDHVSEELGVFAEPEIVTKTLNPHDKFIVIASDGVFEFLTSQTVVNIVKTYRDPLEACRAVVEEAYNRWLQFEVRTDDITCIILQVEPHAPNAKTAKLQGRSSIINGQDVLLAMQDSIRPVRGLGVDVNKSWRSRDTIVGGYETVRMSMTNDDLATVLLSPSAEYDVKKHAVAKSDADTAKLRRMVKNNFLFSHLTEEKLNDVLSVMEKRTVAQGTVVIKQNDDGDRFYLVDSGRFDVRVLGPTEPEAAPPSSTDTLEAKYGPVVHTYVATENSHPTFGELALMYSKPRAATVIAQSAGTLWTIDRLAFRSILVRRPLRNVVQRLRNLSLLRSLTVAQLNLLAEEMKEVEFTKGAVIFNEGTQDGKFYLIVRGSVTTTRRANAAPTVVHAHESFGDFVLTDKKPSPYTATAAEDTECLCISREAFEATLGQLSLVVEKNNARRDRKSLATRKKLTAPLNGLVVLTDNVVPTLKSLTTFDQLKAGPTIFQDHNATYRLVRHNSTTMTLRSISKQTVVKSNLKQQLLAEQDMYVALGRTQAGLANLYAITKTNMDLHALFVDPFVGVLEDIVQFPLKNELEIRYYGAQLVSAVQMLHAEGILARSLDPTHLMVDTRGNLAVFGLNLSKYIGAGRTFTICGNPEYLAPEHINGQGQSLATDYWSLGILLYEMLVGETPFAKYNKDELAMFNSIVTFTPDTLEFPSTASPALKSLIQGLLQSKPASRLGAADCFKKTSDECIVPKHPFFNGVVWQDVNRAKSPLGGQASAKYEQLLAAFGSPASLDLGIPYTGDAAWMSDF